MTADRNKRLTLLWNIANSGATQPGSVGWVGPDSGGWPGFVRAQVQPAVAWCEESGVTPAVCIHSAFGEWAVAPQQVHIDAYDHARASGCDWLVKDFATAWRPLAAKYELIAYVGNAHNIAHLPPAEQAETIRRNVRPLLSAGFSRIVVDAASMAVVHDSDETKDKRSPLAFQLNVVDALMRDEYGLTNRAEIEAIPPNFRHYKDLAARDCWCSEVNFWQTRIVAKARGYSDRKHLTGRVHRLLRYTEGTPQETVAIAQAIVRDGDVAAIQPAPLMQAKARASEIFAGKK